MLQDNPNPWLVTQVIAHIWRVVLVEWFYNCLIGYHQATHHWSLLLLFSVTFERSPFFQYLCFFLHLKFLEILYTGCRKADTVNLALLSALADFYTFTYNYSCWCVKHNSVLNRSINIFLEILCEPCPV